MNKIPVGRTIGQAYSFSFGRYFPVLGILWLPMLAMGALAYFLLVPFYEKLPELMHQTQQHGGTLPPSFLPALGQLFRWLGLFELLTLAILTIMSVGITKEALGLRRGPRFVYLSIGAAELRVIGGYILMMVLVFAGIIGVEIVGIVFGIVIYAAMAAAGHSQFDPKSIVAFVPLVLVVIEFVCFYFMIRLSFLMVPVTVAENRIGIWRSWELTKGNVWRIVGILLAVFVPIIILEIVVGAVAFGPAFGSFIVALVKSSDGGATQIAALTKNFVPYFAMVWLVAFLLAPILYGLMMSPAAFAYRALVPADGAAPMTDGSPHR